MKIGAMESLNALEEKMRKSKEYNSEEHSNSNCHYLILYEFHIKNTHLQNVTIFLGICDCGYNDCSDMRNQKNIYTAGDTP